MTLNTAISCRIDLLTSKSGRPYVGCDVPRKHVQRYLYDFFTEGTLNYRHVRKNQIIRDRGRFHVTIVSPPEFETVGRALAPELVGKPLSLSMTGLGKAMSEDMHTFFVVVQSDSIDRIRKSLGLGPRDLHITIGFNKEDVHGVTKDQSTLIGCGSR